MYLSRIVLDTKLRVTMAALASPNRMHGAVESCFQGEKQRNLWRIDWLSGQCYLLIASAQRPDMAGRATQFGSQMAGESKAYDPLLAKVKDGQGWHFRLCANPVHSATGEQQSGGARGKVYAHVTQLQQKQWLMDRAEKHGFALDPDGFEVVHSQWLRFRKGREPTHEVSLLRVTFEGLLRVIDAERFKETLITGIGREKAYGCGLLTITSSGGTNA